MVFREETPVITYTPRCLIICSIIYKHGRTYQEAGLVKIRLRGNEHFTQTKRIVESHCLHTICTSGKSPNMGECWSRGTATFMIGGDICTRSCRFCNTLTGKPLPLDPKEPENVAESIRLMQLKHAVVTSVDRDDLPDLVLHTGLRPSGPSSKSIRKQHLKY